MPILFLIGISFIIHYGTQTSPTKIIPMTTFKTISKIALYTLFLFSAILTACTSKSSPLQTANSTKTIEPIALSTGNPITSTAVFSPTISITEKRVTPTSIPSPTPTPTLAYSYLPPISEANVTQVEKFDQLYGGVNSIAISPNGKYVAAAYDNGAGLIWDISAAKRSWLDWHKVPKKLFTAKGPVSFNPDNSVMATGGSLIDLNTMKINQELPGTVTFSPSGKTLALVESDAVSFWKFNGVQWVLDYKQENKFVASLTFSPDGNLLGEALPWGSGEGVNIWRMSDHKLLYSFPPSEHGHGAHFNFNTYAFVAFSPDSQFVATGTKDEPAVRIWNIQSGDLVKDFSTVVKMEDGFYAPDVECVSFSQDAKIIVIGAYKTVIFKRIPDGEYLGMLEVNPLTSHLETYITACATSNDGKLLIVGDSSGDVSFWGVPTSIP